MNRTLVWSLSIILVNATVAQHPARTQSFGTGTPKQTGKDQGSTNISKAPDFAGVRVGMSAETAERLLTSHGYTSDSDPLLSTFILGTHQYTELVEGGSRNPVLLHLGSPDPLSKYYYGNGYCYSLYVGAIVLHAHGVPYDVALCIPYLGGEIKSVADFKKRAVVTEIRAVLNQDYGRPVDAVLAEAHSRWPAVAPNWDVYTFPANEGVSVRLLGTETYTVPSAIDPNRRYISKGYLEVDIRDDVNTEQFMRQQKEIAKHAFEELRKAADY